MTSHRNRTLALAGNPRHQEANRKRLLRELQRFEAESLRRAKESAKARAILADSDVATIAKNHNRTQQALCDALRLDDEQNAVASYIAKLLGIPPEERTHDAILDRLIGLSSRTQPVQPVQPMQPALPEPKRAPVTADSALAEAMRIVGAASDLGAIDWTREPQSERERAIRAAIIARVEAEAEAARRSPTSTLWQLEDLGGHSFGLASDLTEAIQRWNQRADDANAERVRKEKQRLLDQARRDVDGR